VKIKTIRGALRVISGDQPGLAKEAETTKQPNRKSSITVRNKI
jgi:hypothetical protein